MRVGVGVVEGHLRLVVEVDPDPVDPLDLGDGVGHRRLHPDAEHVELEHAEVLDVVLVELAHREAGVRRLDGGPVEQGARRRAAPRRGASRRGGAARRAARPAGRTGRAAVVGEAAGGELGQVAQRRPGVAGADVGERLGDRVDLARRHPERATDVAHRVADPVGVHHRDADAPLPAVAVEDRLVDLEPARGLDVDVDVGQRVAQRREEPLHQQVVADRVDAGDAEQVVDQAAGPRAAGRAPHAHVADQVGDVADGEEVGGEAQAADHLQLVVEPLPDPLPGRRAVAVADPGLAALAEQPVGPAGSPVAGGGRARAGGPGRSRGRRPGRGRTGRRRCGCRPAASSPPAPGRPRPASRQTSSATSAICLPDLRNPSALPRSRWRRSSATSRRAASRTSTVGASSRSA